MLLGDTVATVTTLTKLTDSVTSTVRLVLPNVDQLEGVSIEGGSNQLTSGGVRVDTSGTSGLVSSEFRTRNLRSVNSSRHFHNHAQLHPGALEALDSPDRWRVGGSTFFGPLNKHQAVRYTGESRQ